MFLGQCVVELDQDDTLPLPEQFQNNLSDQAFLTQGFDRNLLILSESAFKEMYDRVTGMSISNPLARLLLRMLLGNATKLEQEKRGHIRIPANLKEFLELGKEGVLVGQGEYFEIWSLDHWKEQIDEFKNAEMNSNRFASLDLACW